MKITLLIGTLITAFVYLLISMFNKTWDIMKYSQDSTYWFGCLIGLGWFACFLWYVLEIQPKTEKDYYGNL
jgi:hypothetical protein